MFDLGAYSKWNPFIVEVSALGGPLKVGDEFTLHVVWSDGKATRIQPPGEIEGVARAELAYRFTGWMHAINLVRAQRVQSLEQQPGGHTLYSSVERLTGFGAKYAPIALVQDGFERHARALKQYVEKRSADRAVSRWAVGDRPRSARCRLVRCAAWCGLASRIAGRMFR